MRDRPDPVDLDSLSLDRSDLIEKGRIAGGMDGNRKEPIPDQFDSFEAAADFWDTHSLADYWNQTGEVEIEVRAQRRWLMERTRA